MNYLSNVVRSEGDPKIVRSGPSAQRPSDKLAKALGWFSIGLGLAELVAPGRITQALGLQGRESLVRAFGIREIAGGVVSLSTEKDVGLWSRLAGDGLDIAALLSAMRDDNPKRDNVALGLVIVLGVSLLDLFGAQSASARQRSEQGQRRSYHDRSGFPNGVQAARGAARDFSISWDTKASPRLGFDSAPRAESLSPQ